MISKTHFAITGEDTRYFLNGALFLQRPDAIGLVSTDGHRLAHKQFFFVTRSVSAGAADRRRGAT